MDVVTRADYLLVLGPEPIRSITSESFALRVRRVCIQDAFFELVEPSAELFIHIRLDRRR
jgi:hypothetical protein